VQHTYDRVVELQGDQDRENHAEDGLEDAVLGPGGSRGVGVRTPVPDVTTALLAADL